MDVWWPVDITKRFSSALRRTKNTQSGHNSNVIFQQALRWTTVVGMAEIGTYMKFMRYNIRCQLLYFIIISIEVGLHNSAYDPCGAEYEAHICENILNKYYILGN